MTKEQRENFKQEYYHAYTEYMKNLDDSRSPEEFTIEWFLNRFDTHLKEIGEKLDGMKKMTVVDVANFICVYKYLSDAKELISPKE